MKSLLAVLGLALAMPALAASQADRGPPGDLLAVRNAEVVFHSAGSVLPENNLDRTMSIYTDDAVLTDTAHGTRQQGL